MNSGSEFYDLAANRIGNTLATENNAHPKRIHRENTILSPEMDEVRLRRGSYNFETFSLTKLGRVNVSLPPAFCPLGPISALSSCSTFTTLCPSLSDLRPTSAFFFSLSAHLRQAPAYFSAGLAPLISARALCS